MAFIRNSPEMLDKMHTYPKHASFQAFQSLPVTLYDAEESEYSHWFFSEDDSFTFLQFEGTVNAYDTILISDAGTFYSTTQKQDWTTERRQRLARLSRPEHPPKAIRPTFSEEGVEYEATVNKDGHGYEGGLWFDAKHATYVETGWLSPREREQKAYFMRREPYGPITQRREPRERWLRREGEDNVDECLYKH